MLTIENQHKIIKQHNYRFEIMSVHKHLHSYHFEVLDIDENLYKNVILDRNVNIDMTYTLKRGKYCIGLTLDSISDMYKLVEAIFNLCS